MPYIRDYERKLYDPHIEKILALFNVYQDKCVAGHFTYIVFRLLKFFNKRYWTRALGVGCLVMAILEIYRECHAEYEDLKKKENGSIS